MSDVLSANVGELQVECNGANAWAATFEIGEVSRLRGFWR